MTLEELNSLPKHRLDNAYLEHSIFNKLKDFSEFYNFLSFSTTGSITSGTLGLINLDSYVFSSIEGTINSISDILKNGRMGDAYALLRKYYDSTIINIYTNLYIEDNRSMETYIIKQIENWRKGTESIPEYRIISKYIKDSNRLKFINEKLDNLRYKQIRNNCNDHTHYNFYENVLMNDNTLYNPKRIQVLDSFSKDIEDLFVQHFVYLFSLNPQYMSSSTYIDNLDCGLTPPENSQYWVAKFVQDIFDNYLKKNHLVLAELLIKDTCMDLE